MQIGPTPSFDAMDVSHSENEPSALAARAGIPPDRVNVFSIFDTEHDAGGSESSGSAEGQHLAPGVAGYNINQPVRVSVR